MTDARPNPDVLLARVQADEARRRRGKLKMFFGAAPGIGKTYAMLEAARKVAKEGLDVVIGYVEPHARPETQALVLGLDVLTKRGIAYRRRQLLDFDLQAALDRPPQLLIVGAGSSLADTGQNLPAETRRELDVSEPGIGYQIAEPDAPIEE